jgi:RNA polymerase sigma factor (sigma-70 family)
VAADARRTIDAIWRIESARIIGAVARMVRDVGLAEEIAQDALVTALERWPSDGIPDNPGAWLTAAAKHGALDRLRQAATHARRRQELGADADARGDHVVPDFVDALDAARDDEIGDDVLRLMFTACHPVLPREGQVALTLKLLGGLTTAEIARAYFVPEPTIAQRIVRAKKTLGAARVPFEVPRGPELAARLAAVLEVVYLVFNEGYAATRGRDWIRSTLCDEALRLARMLAGLASGEAEVQGLLALLEIQASRQQARTDADGQAILLLEQDRGRWDPLLIQRGLAALERAECLAGERGPYHLQACIAACHAHAATAAETDWPRIVAFYDALAERVPSPVIALNRAVAVGMAYGPEAALPIVEGLLDDPLLQRSHLLPAVHGDLLARLGRAEAARSAFERAATMTQNEREREALERRAREATVRRDGPAGSG